MISLEQIDNIINNMKLTLPEIIYNIPGLTSKFNQTLLNIICQDKEVLEIGTLYGASTFAIGYNNNSNILTVDTWEGCETVPINNDLKINSLLQPKEFFINNLKDFNNINYINGNIFSKEVYNKLITKDFDIIYYDGPHEIQEIVTFIGLYNPLFSNCILIFDDYNFESVQHGIEIGLKEFNIHYKFKKEIVTAGESRDNIWNGMCFLIF